MSNFRDFDPYVYQPQYVGPKQPMYSGGAAPGSMMDMAAAPVMASGVIVPISFMFIPSDYPLTPPAASTTETVLLCHPGDMAVQRLIISWNKKSVYSLDPDQPSLHNVQVRIVQPSRETGADVTLIGPVTITQAVKNEPLEVEAQGTMVFGLPVLARITLTDAGGSATAWWTDPDLRMFATVHMLTAPVT